MKYTLALILFLSMFITSGCMDRVELNDLAIELGWAMDKTPNGQYLVSTQFTIPSKLGGDAKSGGSGENGYFVESGTGKTILEATQDMQTKLSRRVFRGQRRAIFIGEDLARSGIRDVLDTYTRDPDVRLRAEVFVVKGAKAQDALKLSYPYERVPALASVKIDKVIGGAGDSSLRNFLIASSTEGSSPIMPAIEIDSTDSSESEQGQGKEGEQNSANARIYGTAIFAGKALKLVGFLSKEEAAERFWVMGELPHYTLTGRVPEGKGMVSIQSTHLGGHIVPVIQNNQIHFYVTLTGKGDITENTTPMDLTKTENLKIVEKDLEESEQKHILQTIKNVQEQYRTDIFGFGETIHRRDPRQWTSLKKRWIETFPKTKVSVRVKLTIRRVGITGPSLQLQEDEIKK